MLALFLCLAILCSESSFWNLGKTDIYNHSNVLVTKSAVIIQEFGEPVIWRFDKITKDKKPLTRLGQAPHEFNSPYVKMMWDNTSLWLEVIGQRKVIEFRDSGDFVRSFKVPADLFYPWKVPGGWVAMTGLTAGSWSKHACLVFCNDDFSTREEIQCWESEEKRGSAFALNPQLLLFDPSISRTLIQPFFNNQYLALQIANLDTFYVFDIKTRALILEKKVDNPRIKFDNEWGKRELARENEGMPAGFKQKPNFPDYFPQIKFVIGTEWGHVVLHRWGIPIERELYTTYDLKGDVVDEDELAECSYPIVRIDGENAYFRFLQEDESWSVGLLPIKELMKLHKEKPLKYEFSFSQH